MKIVHNYKDNSLGFLGYVEKQGFTLMELLIVITLSIFIVSLVTPKAISLYDHLSARMIKMQLQGLADRTSYEAFIRQASCVLANIESDDGESRITISCDQKIIYDQLADTVYLETGGKWFYNIKGFLTEIKENDNTGRSGTETQRDPYL